MTVAARWTKYRPLALKISASYFIPGQEAEDVRQEALVALWVAASEYDKERGTFPPFARVVIHRRLQEVVRQANTGKHLALTEAARDFDVPAPDVHIDGRLGRMLDALPALSDLERRALAASLNGQPIGSKQHDNALQRARTKLRRAA